MGNFVGCSPKPIPHSAVDAELVQLPGEESTIPARDHQLLSRDLMEKRDCNPGRLNFRGRTFIYVAAFSVESGHCHMLPHSWLQKAGNKSQESRSLLERQRN